MENTNRTQLLSYFKNFSPKKKALDKVTANPLSLFFEVTDSLDVILIISNNDGKIVHCNKAFFNLLGYQAVEVYGKLDMTQLLCCDPDSESNATDLLLKSKQNDIFQVILSSSHMTLSANNVEYTIHTLIHKSKPQNNRHLDNKKEAHHAYDKEKRFLKSFSESPIGMFFLTPDLKLEWSNSSFNEFFKGIDVNSFLPDLFELEDKENLEKSISKLLKGQSKEEKITINHSNQNFCKLPLTLVLKINFDNTGKLSYFFGTLLDLPTGFSGEIDNLKCEIEFSEEMKNTLQFLSQEYKLEILSISENCPSHIFADKYRILQVIKILLDNSIKNHEYTVIKIGWKLVNDRENIATLQCSIKICGSEIPDEIKKTLKCFFDQQNHFNPELQKNTSLQLNLNLAIRIVALLGGYIGFESQENEDVLFYFTIKAGLSESAHPPTIDWEGFRNRCGNDKEFIRKMISLYLESSVKTLKLLSDELKNRNRSLVCHLAHKYKGSVSTFKVEKITEICSFLEDRAESENFDILDAKFDALILSEKHLSSQLRIYLDSDSIAEL